MKWTAAGTILASIVLSAMTALWIVRHGTSKSTTAVQTSKIELLDKQGTVRGTFGMVEVNGHERPQITLKGEDGRNAVSISVDDFGQGTIYFDSIDKEGKVALGHVWGSDVTAPDNPDPLAFWGIRVLGKNGKDQTFGVTDRDVAQSLAH